MYDLTAVRRRYFKVKLKNGRVIDVEPPKLKLVNQLVHVAKSANNNDAEALQESVNIFLRVLNKNKQGYHITVEQAQEWFDFDDMIDLLGEFFGWLNQEKRDPN